MEHRRITAIQTSEYFGLKVHRKNFKAPPMRVCVLLSI